MQGLVQKGVDLLIGEEYWDYLGGENTFEEILNLFDLVGKQYKQKIAEKIIQVAESKQKF